MKSLNVIEILRKAHIPVMQALSKDSLSAQLAVAEKAGVPYTIIFGQKEAMENSVIVAIWILAVRIACLLLSSIPTLSN